MTIVWNEKTGNAEADIRANGLGRLHVSLRTKKKGEAEDRHAAVKALFLEGNSQLIERVRGRKLPMQAIVRVHQSKKPFETLLETSVWPTLKQATDEYLLHMQQQTDKAPSTYTLAEWHLGAAIEYFGADRRVDTITHDDVEAWKLALLGKETELKSGEKRKIKPYTAAISLVRLNALYTWLITREGKRAAREKRLPRMLHTPVDRDIVPKKSTPRQRFLDKEEAQRLLAATPEALKFPIATGLLAGLRIDEVCNLRPPPQDINLEVGGGIILVQEKELADGRRWRPKSKKPRDIPIESELLPLLVRHVEKFASPAWMVPSVYDPDLPISKHTLQQMFTRVVKDAGLIPGQRNPSGVTFHTLRHTFASWLVMAGVDLFTVSKLMGHGDTKQVEQTYGHLSPNHKRIAIDRLAQSYQLGLETSAEA